METTNRVSKNERGAEGASERGVNAKRCIGREQKEEFCGDVLKQRNDKEKRTVIGRV